MVSKLDRIVYLCDEWNGCKRCALHRERNSVVQWRGSPDAKLFILGEAPGADEDKHGRPFVGRSGRMLDQLLLWSDLAPENDVFVANLVGCRPPNNRMPSRDETKTCWPRIARMLQIVNPHAILATGLSAAKKITGIQSISAWRGTEIETELLAPDRSILRCVVVPTFHPSYLLRNGVKGEIKKQMLHDIAYAWSLANAY